MFAGISFTARGNVEREDLSKQSLAGGNIENVIILALKFYLVFWLWGIKQRTYFSHGFKKNRCFGFGSPQNGGRPTLQATNLASTKAEDIYWGETYCLGGRSDIKPTWPSSKGKQTLQEVKSGQGGNPLYYMGGQLPKDSVPFCVLWGDIQLISKIKLQYGWNDTFVSIQVFSTNSGEKNQTHGAFPYTRKNDSQ